MAEHRLYEQFVARFGAEVPESDGDFVDSILNEAEDTILDMIGRDTLPRRLDSAVVLLSVGAYNKRGAEGESSRSEGGISRAFDDLPEPVRKRIQNYPRKVGVVRETDDSRHSTL